MEENVRVCDICGREIKEEEGTWVDDQFLCHECVDEHCTTCEHCSETIWVNDSVQDDNITLCQTCYDDHYHQQIADALNADGFLTKIGKPFTRNSFTEILRNEKYTGVYVFNRSEAKGYDNKRNSHRNKPPEEIIRIEGGIPAIISRETWEAAQEKRISHMHHARHCNCVYMLSRLVVCGVCGKMMHGTIRLRNNLPPYHTYTCGTKKADCDNPKAIEKNSLEQYIVALVEKKCITYAEPSLQASFLSLGRDSLEFRTLLQRFINRIEVFPEKVIVKLYVNGKVKSFRRERRAFKTPSQRCFKDKS